MNRHAHDLARITNAYAAIIARTANAVLREAGAAGLAQFSQQEMQATFNIAQAHLGRDAALAMLRAVEQTTARRLS